MPISLDTNELEIVRAAIEKGEPLALPELLDSGAMPLLQAAHLTCGPLPFPALHYEMLQLIEQIDPLVAGRMKKWQEGTLDHKKRPIRSFLTQELGSVPSFSVDDLPSTFIDRELGLMVERGGGHTFYAAASGCKSGLGALLQEQGGVVNYGPHVSPIGDTSGFGIVGRPKFIEIHDKSLYAQTAVAAPSHRQAYGVQDADYSSLWIETKHNYTPNIVQTTCTFEGMRPLDEVTFALYLKAPSCLVGGLQKLSPRSLDRYQGPPQPIQLPEGLVIEKTEGPTSMEVIPLAGDQSFWGADFLVAYSGFKALTLRFVLNQSN